MSNPLVDEIYTESELLELLGIKRSTLDILRLEKGLPYIRLTPQNRIYMAGDIYNWLKQRSERP